MGTVEHHAQESTNTQTVSSIDTCSPHWAFSLNPAEFAVDYGATAAPTPLRNRCGCIAASPDQKPSSSKRSPEFFNDDDDAEAGGKQDTPRAVDSGKESGGEKPNAPIFACPFLRRYPVRHKDCLNLRLKRTRDVKQHLQRRHFPSPIYCPICFLKFPSEAKRDKHVRSQQCERRDPTTEDLVSPRAQALLKQPVSRKLSPSAQWYSIWETLFPHQPLPSNPYLGTVVEEGVGMIRQFWARNGSGIIAKHLEMPQMLPVNDVQLNQLMMRLLDDVSGRLEQSDLKTDEGRTSPTVSAASTEFDMDRSDISTQLSPPLNMDLWDPTQIPDNLLFHNFSGNFDSGQSYDFFADTLDIPSSLEITDCANVKGGRGFSHDQDSFLEGVDVRSTCR